MPTITFQPSGMTIEVQKNANLMIATLRAGLPVGSSCSGQGICGKCVMTVVAGEKNLAKQNSRECALSKRESLQPNERISCQTKVVGDVTISTTYW